MFIFEKAGKEAYLAGRPQSSCPFTETLSGARFYWLRGWLQEHNDEVDVRTMPTRIKGVYKQ